MARKVKLNLKALAVQKLWGVFAYAAKLCDEKARMFFVNF